MTERLLFTARHGLSQSQIAFVRYPDLSALPDRPGLFALLGPRSAGQAGPLYFGHADHSMLRQIPQDPGFGHAIRRGLTGFAAAYLPSGVDPRALVDALAANYDAPVNAAAHALAEIEHAQAKIHKKSRARQLIAH
ncbi:hypothetical protein [Pseudooceanicola sp.]|uniref:hypothetical protein n=1 Tax=Pseudooceanicola sp. TaxID=1914328 RepID=UPI004058FC31